MTLLRKGNQPVFKRYYLFFGLLLSIAIPFIEFNVNRTITETVFPVTINSQLERIYTEVEILPNQSENVFPIIWIIISVYIFMFAILLFRYVKNIVKLIRLKKNNPVCLFKGYKVVLVDSDSPPYSFLDTIYVNKEDYINGTMKTEILIHELAHVKQRHSIDILLIELWIIAFWFNPFLWLYKREIRLNHEYLADSDVIGLGVNMDEYQHIMLSAVFENNSSFLVSGYSYLFIKNRLTMLVKKKNLKEAWAKGALAVSLVVLFSAVISCSEEHIQITKTESEWWQQILEKHNLKLGAYNNFGDVFEMGKNGISIVDDISTIKDAIVLIKRKDEYILIEADTVIHNLSEGVLNAVPGFVRIYKFESDSAYMTGNASRLILKKSESDTIYITGNDFRFNVKIRETRDEVENSTDSTLYRRRVFHESVKLQDEAGVQSALNKLRGYPSVNLKSKSATRYSAFLLNK